MGDSIFSGLATAGSLASSFLGGSGNSSSNNGYASNIFQTGDLFGGSSLPTSSTGNNSSWFDGLASFGSGVGDWLGSDTGKNVLSAATPIVSGLITADATTKAAEMQADTYAKQLAADQARIDEDKESRSLATAAMTGGFSNSGLGA